MESLNKRSKFWENWNFEKIEILKKMKFWKKWNFEKIEILKKLKFWKIEILKKKSKFWKKKVKILKNKRNFDNTLKNLLGFDLSEDKATQLVNYSNSYRQCLMNLQLWLNGYPKTEPQKRTKGPVEDLNGLSSPLCDLNLKTTNITEIENFYKSGINLVSMNR